MINCDQKQCLKTCIVRDYFHLVIMFFEVQLRIFVNFFSKIVDCYINSYAKKRYIYLINRLETILKEKYPEMTPEIYYSRRKKLVHLGLEKSIDQYPNYLMFLKDIESFFNFKNEFEFCRLIKIAHTIKWKFDYIIFRK